MSKPKQSKKSKTLPELSIHAPQFETSDESFAWTDASESSDSDDNNKVKMDPKDEDSESGKNYKEKIQKILFEKQKSPDKHRKRKLSQQSTDSEQNISPKKRKIKVEPESDIDGKERKISHTETNGYHNGTTSPVTNTHTDNCETPTKKSKKRKEIITSEDNELVEEVKKEDKFEKRISKKENSQSHDESDIKDDLQEGSNAENELVKEVKKEGKFEKRKSKKEIRQSNDESETKDNVEDAFSAEETVVEGHKSSHSSHSDGTSASEDDSNVKHKTKETPKKNKQNVSNSEYETSTSEDDSNVKHKTKKTPKKDGTLASDDDSNVKHRAKETPKKNKQNVTMNETHTDVSLSEMSISRIDTTEHDITHNLSTSNKSNRRISERIQFEDDRENDSEYAKEELSIPKKLKHFVKKNNDLHLFNPDFECGPNLTDNDEVWIIKCPKNVDVKSFINKNLVLQNKCKIKLDGQTYEGNVDANGGNVCIVNKYKNQLVINNVSINGYINLHKRIPKLHIQEDSAIVSNQPSFIPLPETKCRHPLFGANYKKAIKIPSSIKARLKEDLNTEFVRKPKKVHKKENLHNGSVLKDEKSFKQASDSSEVVDHITSDKKKKKKRKHSTGEPEAPPVKKVKKSRNLESAEAWESEQAIEENLFDF